MESFGGSDLAWTIAIGDKRNYGQWTLSFIFHIKKIIPHFMADAFYPERTYTGAKYAYLFE